MRYLGWLGVAISLFVTGCIDGHGPPSDERANAEPLRLEVDPTFVAPPEPGAICDRGHRDTVCARFESAELSTPVAIDHGGLLTVSVDAGIGDAGWCAQLQVEEMPEGIVATACQYP